MKKPLLKDLTLEQKIGQLLLGYQWDICRKTEVDHNIFRTWEEREEVLKKELEDRGANVTITRRLKNNEELAEYSAKSDLIIYATYIGGHEPMGPPSLFGEELKTYLHAFTSGKENHIIF